MKSLWQPETRGELKTRLSRLTPTRSQLWGRMSAPQMVSHLVESMRMATGELPVAPKWTPMRYPPLKQFVVYWMPFPKGVPTAPELLARPPQEWTADVGSLAGAIERFAARGVGASWPDHPAFGRLTGRQWGALAYRHIDHHLRQFGA